jgi:hypothetical protein
MNHISTDNHLSQITKKLQELNINPYQNNPNRSILSQMNLAKRQLQLQRQEATERRQHHLTFCQEILVLNGKKTKLPLLPPSKERNEELGASANSTIIPSHQDRQTVWHM